MKNCLITHIGDPDGAFPIIFCNLVFSNTEFFSCEVDEVDEITEDVLSNHEDYEKIYVVDLCFNEDLAKKINDNEILKNKVLVFDHHASREPLNKYSFIKVVSEKDGKKECGTTLFLKYLQEFTNNEILYKSSLLEMVELVRELDTYDFLEEKKEDAFKFGDLYNIYGRDNYIENYTNFIKNNNTFFFTEFENKILELEKDRKERYIDEKLEFVKKATIDEIPVGIVFAERYRSDLGHAIVTKIPDVDIAVIINISRSVSYRASKDEIDVNVLAVPLGGGGHKHAGGSAIPEGLEEKIVEYIFKNIKWDK